jgi:hypothetical protein
MVLTFVFTFAFVCFSLLESSVGRLSLCCTFLPAIRKQSMVLVLILVSVCVVSLSEEFAARAVLLTASGALLLHLFVLCCHPLCRVAFVLYYVCLAWQCNLSNCVLLVLYFAVFGLCDSWAVVLPCLALTWLALLCLLVLSCLVLSCFVLSCLASSCLVFPCLVFSCRASCCLVLCYLLLLALSCLALCCIVLWCGVIC